MIILASASPRRQEILKEQGYDFQVVPSTCEEIVNPTLAPVEVAKSLAKQKAQDVAKAYPADTVIGADTIVVNGDKILGKPHSEQEAFDMLRSLAGKAHQVITGVAVVRDGKCENYAEVTNVHFFPLTDEEIWEYVETGEPMDKAGSYGIQGLGGLFVKEIEGDYLNVVGLPVERLKEIL